MVVQEPCWDPEFQASEFRFTEGRVAGLWGLPARVLKREAAHSLAQYPGARWRRKGVAPAVGPCTLLKVLDTIAPVFATRPANQACLGFGESMSWLHSNEAEYF